MPHDSHKGQSFEPFRLLIAVVMALAILSIIVGVIQQVEQQQRNISLEALRHGFVTALNSIKPLGADNDEFVVKKNVPLQAGRYVPQLFARENEIPYNCICFETPEPLQRHEITNPNAPAGALERTYQVFDVPHSRTSDLYYQCFQSGDVCEIRCRVGIDVKPVNEC